MDRSKLQSLKNRYRAEGKKYSADSIKKLYDKHIRNREKSLIDSLTAAAALGAILYVDKIDLSEISPQMESAFHMAFPSKSIDSIYDMHGDELTGLVSAWKGKYFEVIVADKLNQGEWVGELHLEEGQVAQLADSVTQPGWDMQILNPDGSIAHELSLKATDSLSYLKSALERYPDIDILTTDDVLSNTDAISDHLISSGMYNNDLEEAIVNPISSLMDSPLEDVMEAVLPGLPFVIIALSEGRHVIMGKRSFEKILPNILKRSTKAGISIGAGFLSTFIIPDIFSIAVVAGVRMSLDRFDRMKKTITFIDKKTEIIHPLSHKYSR